jgi:hypothetical protein
VVDLHLEMICLIPAVLSVVDLHLEMIFVIVIFLVIWTMLLKFLHDFYITRAWHVHFY